MTAVLTSSIMAKWFAPLPNAKHINLQCHIVDLLNVKGRGYGRASMELAYRPVAEFDLRAADVAVVSWHRWQGIDPEDNLHGAPEFVIEIKSPSNTNRELRGLASLCLANGELEFWIADITQRSFTVIRRDGSTTLYQSGQSIPLALFGAEAIAGDELFPIS